jgi:hypothetical protein
VCEMGEAACLIPVDIEGEIYSISVQCMMYISREFLIPSVIISRPF